MTDETASPGAQKSSLFMYCSFFAPGGHFERTAMLIGYARVSTEAQSNSAQIEALKAAGCEKIFSENISGKHKSRPEFDRLMEELRPDDVLVVWKLDRLGRSLPNLISIMENLKSRNIGFRSLTEQIDYSSAVGKFFFQMMAIFAEYERNIIRERTNNGLAHARAAGRITGRPSKLNEKQIREIGRILNSGSMSTKEVADVYEVSEATAYRAKIYFNSTLQPKSTGEKK